ncbi:dual specificity phosphatase 28 [Periophthalmus magnuspinnatus]|uniref:dual specificity phosphatase 28 n=1 Tax=Periophthalmus magnuspinnatus TaxID=409849 RepID=UPI00145ABC07|nr:dual specificity phosphatase 28 [Periophthalmus magnuspinnatus]
MLELCKVTPSLFISNARSACSTELLQQEAVTQCINVTRQQPFPSTTVAKMQVSVFDDPHEDLYTHFGSCADAIEAEAQRGGKTLVYCKNGRSRSATICAAYLLKYQQLTLEGALQKVKEARHVIEPNPGFMLQLQKYEEELRQRRGQT